MGLNILIVTSSGGGGLLQSAIAIEQEQKKINPQVKIIKRDLLIHWMGFLVGKGARFFYNWTQRSGNVFLTNVFVGLNVVAEFLFYPVVFFRALHTLFKYKIDKVIDNQPMNTSSIIKAIRFYNWISKKRVIIEKVFVDLPTKEYCQILKGIKKVSQEDKKYLTIFTLEPLLEKEKTNEEYWQRYCKISESKIIYKKYIVRDAFKNFQNQEKLFKNFDLRIKTGSFLEKQIIRQCFEKGSIRAEEKEGDFVFAMEPEDKLFTIVLGSQPSYIAILSYLKGFIEVIKEKGLKDKKFHLFIFADKFKENKKTLFHTILDLIKKDNNYPKNLSVVPMSFQKDEVIAPLFFRSDLSITRSGGHTIMELMAVSKGIKWIHSEAVKKAGEKDISYKNLLKGIPCWEAGNARYLKEKFNGDVVTKDTIYQKLDLIIN